MSTAGLLDGRVALVDGGHTGLGHDIALGLADEGASVAVAAGFESRAAAEAAFGEARDAHRPIDVVVHVPSDANALVTAALVDTPEPEWEARCEALVRRAIWCCQAAHTAMRGHGGRIVVVTPTVGLTGAIGLVPFTTAVEGIRAMAKSAARQWGELGITVNCVAPPVELLAPGTGVAGPWIAPSALGGLPDGRADVAAVVALLASGRAHAITGATVTVDGGVVMAP